jgi:hypothetical protein
MASTCGGMSGICCANYLRLFFTLSCVCRGIFSRRVPLVAMPRNAGPEFAGEKEKTRTPQARVFSASWFLAEVTGCHKGNQF